jgi:hypothetical protein
MSTNLGAAQHLPQFGWSPNKFTLHNASPEPLVVRWASLQFTIPAKDVIGTKPATYDDGAPIPGTYVVQDSWSLDRDGAIPPKNSPPNWSAYEAIRNVLGVDPVTKEALSPNARSGISFLPPNPTRELVAEIRADGERRYEEHLVDWAEQTITGYLDAVQKSRDAHVSPPPPTRDYERARAILDRNRKRDDFSHHEEVVAKEDAEMEAYIEAEAMAMAKRAAEGKEIDEVELAKRLLQKPEIRNRLKRDYSIRKRGHLDVPELGEEP